MTSERNQGEGNREAAREYNEAQQKFVREGKVDEKAAEAERAVDSAEGKDLERAEDEGKRHAKEEDPDIARNYTKPSKD